LKVAAVLLAFVGAFLVLITGYLFWGGTFGQIGVRVPLYPWHVLLSLLAAALGGLVAIWHSRAGAVLLAVSAASLLLLDLQIVFWVVAQAQDNEAGLAGVLTNAAVVFFLPMLLVGLSAYLAWRSGPAKAG
jgi:hypothetical protein